MVCPKNNIHKFNVEPGVEAMRVVKIGGKKNESVGFALFPQRDVDPFVKTFINIEEFFSCGNFKSRGTLAEKDLCLILTSAAIPRLAPGTQCELGSLFPGHNTRRQGDEF